MAKPAKKSRSVKPSKITRRKAQGGKMQAILAMLLKHPTSTNPELLAKLSNVGPEITASTLSTVRSDFLRSVRVLDQAGLLKSNPFAG